MDCKKTVIVKQFQLVLSTDATRLMIYVLDDRGCLWVRMTNDKWERVLLPEETL